MINGHSFTTEERRDLASTLINIGAVRPDGSARALKGLVYAGE